MKILLLFALMPTMLVAQDCGQCSMLSSLIKENLSHEILTATIDQSVILLCPTNGDCIPLRDHLISSLLPAIENGVEVELAQLCDQCSTSPQIDIDLCAVLQFILNDNDFIVAILTERVCDKVKNPVLNNACEAMVSYVLLNLFRKIDKIIPFIEKILKCNTTMSVDSNCKFCASTINLAKWVLLRSNASDLFYTMMISSCNANDSLCRQAKRQHLDATIIDLVMSVNDVGYCQQHQLCIDQQYDLRRYFGEFYSKVAGIVNKAILPNEDSCQQCRKAMDQISIDFNEHTLVKRIADSLCKNNKECVLTFEKVPSLKISATLFDRFCTQIEHCEHEHNQSADQLWCATCDDTFGLLATLVQSSTDRDAIVGAIASNLCDRRQPCYDTITAISERLIRYMYIDVEPHICETISGGKCSVTSAPQALTVDISRGACKLLRSLIYFVPEIVNLLDEACQSIDHGNIGKECSYLIETYNDAFQNLVITAMNGIWALVGCDS